MDMYITYLTFQTKSKNDLYLLHNSQNTHLRFMTLCDKKPTRWQ